MIKSNVSKALSAIVTRTTEELTNSNTTKSYKDYLVASILNNDATMAYNTLSTLMPEWSIGILADAIRSDAAESTIEEIAKPEQYYESLCSLLGSSIAPHLVSTVHILYAAAADHSSATSRQLFNYGINSEDILCAVARLIGSPA